MKRLYGRAVHGSTHPWWRHEAPPDDAQPALEGTVDADVAIVGGGFTGLWTALELKRRRPSTRVVLLEATRCGDGASGRNGGFLHGLWAGLPRLIELLGEGDAVATAREAAGVYEAVRALGDDVWLTEGGMLTVATGPAHDAVIERAVETAARVGAPEEAVLVERDELTVHSPAFRRAVRYRDGATVQPARLVRALRRAALAAGVVVHEHSPVLGLEPSAVACERGRVSAAEIVVATNAAAARWPAGKNVAVFRSAIVLTEPVPRLHELVGWRGGEAISDARTYLNYFRPTNDGRVLMGSASGDLRRAEDALRRFFPALAGVRVAARWEGAIDVSSDRLPFFRTVPGTRIHYGLGYTGNGVGPSWLGGRMLASLVLREELPTALASRRMPALPPEPLRTIGARVVRRALLAVDDAEEAGRKPPAWAPAVARLPELVGLRVASR
ncbi:MAG TPA: FAD-dependent oxidoreductase [Gaiellaceae bacterium]|nr:FAD-dependent oxidoreductase [Gaiellaceae bacterium]